MKNHERKHRRTDDEAAAKQKRLLLGAGISLGVLTLVFLLPSPEQTTNTAPATASLKSPRSADADRGATAAAMEEKEWGTRQKIAPPQDAPQPVRGPDPLPMGKPHCGPQQPLSPTGPKIMSNCIVTGLRGLVRHAERIVVGRVIGKTCRWGPKKDKVYTYWTFAVERTLKGKPARSRRVSVRVLGGAIPSEKVRMEATHQPEFKQGDHGILFIDDDPGLWTQVVGNMQGFLRFEDHGPRAPFTLKDGFGRRILSLTRRDRFQVNGKVAARVTAPQIEARIRRLVG